MNSTQQLELEAEQARRELAGTLDELRLRITPGAVVDQLLDYARTGSGAEFVRNLKRQAVSNPLPMTLVGTGLAWLMLAGSAAGESAAEGTGTAVGDLGAKASGVAGRIGAIADSTVDSAKDAAVSTYDAASGAYGSLADTARTAGRNAAAASRGLADFFADQPLVLAGLGVALGAAMGATLPATEVEDRLMGEVGDRARQAVQVVASDTYSKAAEAATEVASDAYDQAKAVIEGIRHEAPDQRVGSPPADRKPIERVYESVPGSK
jgi:hypothetical protein